MNDQLNRLAKEAGFVFWEDGESVDWASNYDRELEVFADLIVHETIKQMAIQMDKFGDDQSNNPDWYKSEEAVKNYFGVK